MTGGTHEGFDKHHGATPGSPRSFGWVFAGVFSVIGLWPVLHGAPVRPWALAVAVAFAAVTVVRPNLLSLPNVLWFRFGLLLGRIITPVVMGLIFFVGVVPTGLALRLFGKDPLKLKRDPKAASYWIARRPSDPPSSMRNQF
jgi:hypothetical protein